MAFNTPWHGSGTDPAQSKTAAELLSPFFTYLAIVEDILDGNLTWKCGIGEQRLPTFFNPEWQLLNQEDHAKMREWVTVMNPVVKDLALVLSMSLSNTHLTVESFTSTQVVYKQANRWHKRWSNQRTNVLMKTYQEQLLDYMLGSDDV